MDSQENTLNQGTIEEPQVEATVAETPAVENTSEAETKPMLPNRKYSTV